MDKKSGNPSLQHGIPAAAGGLACTLLRLEEPGLTAKNIWIYSELMALLIAKMLMHGILGYVSEKAPHLDQTNWPGGFPALEQSVRCRCGRLPRCSPRAVPRALVVADEAPADDDGDTFFTKVWCGWRRVPIWILDFFSPSHQVMDLKSSNRIKELTAN